MSASVWILQSGSYTEWFVWGVYSSYELAEVEMVKQKLVEAPSSHSGDWWNVAGPYDVDEAQP